MVALNIRANSATGIFTSGTDLGPLDLPLLGIEHITYAGIAEIPHSDGSGQTAPLGRLDFSRGAMCVHPDGETFYMGGNDQRGHIARLTIPEVGQEAEVVTQLRTIVASAGNEPGTSWGTGNNILGFAIPYNDRLVIGLADHYDGSASATHNCFTMSLDLTEQSAVARIGNNGLNPGYYPVRGGLIPEVWRPLLGNYPAWCGSTTGRYSIISRYSYGPNGMFLFDPDLVGVEDPVPTIPLCYYEGAEHPFNTRNSGGASFANDVVDQTLWTGGDALTGGHIIPGTRTMVTIGQHGVNVTYTNSAFHGDYWEWSAWFYDMADFVAVYRGERTPQSVVPYARAVIPGLSTTIEDYVCVGTSFYHPETRRIYVSWTRGTGGQGAHFRVFEIAEVDG
jgi:hypothetical protein